AAKPQPATIAITSVVAVDTRTATVTWTPVKGTDHYVLEWAPAMRVSTSATTATVTDLYPGDEVAFTVRAESKRNQVLATSPYAYVALAPEGPGAPNGYAAAADTVRLWWGSGIGCYTYELAIALPDGTYSTLARTPNYVDQVWQGHQDPATTVSYAVRCASFSGTLSTWSPVTSLTTP
ncbi:MAG TPA: hypothetical protein VFL10_14375, partial [Ornithinibacter sp.]|nr:hypothetical protein [Ornithinibacter sp.]